MKRFFPLCMALGLFAGTVGCDAAKEAATEQVDGVKDKVVDGAKDAANEGMDKAVEATADTDLPDVVKDGVESAHDKVEEATGAAE